MVTIGSAQGLHLLLDQPVNASDLVLGELVLRSEYSVGDDRLAILAGRLMVVRRNVVRNAAGVPVAVSVFKGNTADPTTLLGQVQKVRAQFGLRAVAVVGDRGMISQKQINALRGIDGMQWITALAAVNK